MFILRIPNIPICHYYRTKIVLPKNRWIFLQDSLQSRLILAFTFRSIMYKKSPLTIGGFYGGAKRDRTADLYNAIVALSQLSYSPLIRLYHFSGISLCQEIADQKVLIPNSARASRPCSGGCLAQASFPMQVNFHQTPLYF